MARATTALVDIEIPGRARGGVRVHRPAEGKASYRVVWTDNERRQRERTFRSYQLALDAAHAPALSLASAAGQADSTPSVAVTLGDLVDHYLFGAGRSPKWTSPKSARRPRDIARRVLTATDLALPVEQLVGRQGVPHLAAIMQRAEALGCPPGGGEYDKTGQLLNTLLTVGARDGLLDLSAGNPMTVIKYRISDYQLSDAPQLQTVRYVGEEERPSTDRVHEFIDAARHRFGNREALYFETLAFGGLRPAEANGLGPGQIREDRAGLLVDRQLMELRRVETSGTGQTQRFALPKWGLKRNAWIAPDVHERLTELAAQVRRDSDLPPGQQVLFPAPHGGYRWQQNFRRTVFCVVAQEVGWPTVTVQTRGRAEQHYEWPLYAFRHHYANFLLKDLQQPIVAVARWMGHRDSRVTERMYLKTELADLDRASAAYDSDRRT